MTMKEAKTSLRRQVLEERGGLTEEERQRKSSLIVNRIIPILEELESLRAGGSLFTYMPFGNEADISPVMDWCLNEGIPVVVPRTIKEPKRLQLHRIYGRDELVSGVWGIMEPSGTAPLAKAEQIAAVLVPGVAFDRTGGRIGYGGGYYDRLLADFSSAGLRPLLLAAAFDLQLRPGIPMESHDVKMDRIVTESVCYHRDGSVRA